MLSMCATGDPWNSSCTAGFGPAKLLVSVKKGKEERWVPTRAGLGMAVCSYGGLQPWGGQHSSPSSAVWGSGQRGAQHAWGRALTQRQAKNRAGALTHCPGAEQHPDRAPTHGEGPAALPSAFCVLPPRREEPPASCILHPALLAAGSCPLHRALPYTQEQENLPSCSRERFPLGKDAPPEPPARSRPGSPRTPACAHHVLSTASRAPPSP